MSAYGYRISLFQLARKGRPKEILDFNDQSLNGSLLTVIGDVLKGMVDQGEADDRKSTFFTVDSQRESNWGIVAEASGGDFGSAARAVDVNTGKKTKDILPEEAILRGSRLVLIVPPAEQWGLIISEVQSNASLLTPFVNQLNLRLGRQNLKIHLENEIADGVAWSDYLGRTDVGISGVELVTKQSVDRTNFDFADSAGVSGIRMFVGVEPGSKLAGRVVSALKAVVGRGKQPLKLVGLVGLKAYDDNDFDEEKIVTVQDGQKRILDVSHGWPRFVYRLSDTVRPQEDDFLDGIASTAFSVLNEVGVQPYGAWFPKAL